MKKNKVIIPAMALILFSTAASISGTVAWFTASRVFQTTVGNFSVVEIDGNLECTLAAGEGTVYDAASKSVSVRHTVDVVDSFESGDEPAAKTAGKLWLNSGTMKVGNDTNYTTDANLQVGKVYYNTTDGKYYKATAATTVELIDSNNAVVLTHGSVDHTGGIDAEGKAYVIDSDSDPANPDFHDKGTASTSNWLQKGDVDLPTRNPTGTAKADVYNAVSWTMTFRYNFAGDSAPVAVYLDLAKSSFENIADPQLDFLKSGDGRKTSKGFRVAFYDENTAHDFVWGNNAPINNLPTKYSTGTYDKGTVRWNDDGVYKANKDTASSWDASEWDKIYDLPTHSSTVTYKAGDKVYYDSKFYSCKANNTTGAFDANDWTDLSTAATAYSESKPSYAVGDKVLYGGYTYTCTTAIVSTAGAFDAKKWTRDLALDSTPAYDSDLSYNKGDVVQHAGHTYKCNTNDTTGEWSPARWDRFDDTDDLRYVSGEHETTLYTAEDYVVCDNGYARLDNLNANEKVTWASASAPERVCTIKKDNPGDAYKEVTVKCAAWFEGCDSNVVSGATMECLKANMVFYARTINAD